MIARCICQSFSCFDCNTYQMMDNGAGLISSQTVHQWLFGQISSFAEVYAPDAIFAYAKNMR